MIQKRAGGRRMIPSFNANKPFISVSLHTCACVHMFNVGVSPWWAWKANVPRPWGSTNPVLTKHYNFHDFYGQMSSIDGDVLKDFEGKAGRSCSVDTPAMFETLGSGGSLTIRSERWCHLCDSVPFSVSQPLLKKKWKLISIPPSPSHTFSAGLPHSNGIKKHKTNFWKMRYVIQQR